VLADNAHAPAIDDVMVILSFMAQSVDARRDIPSIGGFCCGEDKKGFLAH
jgi:hypothetical protein